MYFNFSLFVIRASLQLSTCMYIFFPAPHSPSTFDVALLGLFSPEAYDLEILGEVAKLIKPGGKIVFRTQKQGMLIQYDAILYIYKSKFPIGQFLPAFIAGSL